jgi:phosphoribosylformimino-5-aminoimidazole carboxamide ribotide isomerase
MTLFIPAIDLIDGKCVRLQQGDFQQSTTYSHDPLETAKRFEGLGATHLHVVDLDGARAKTVVNLKTLEKLAAHTKLHIDFGGGIQAHEDLERVFSAGARQVTCGSIALKNPSLFTEWLHTYGPEAMILAADVKEREIAVHGWQEQSGKNVHDVLKEFLAHGLQTVLCTDIARDGMLTGPNLPLYLEIMEKFPTLKLIASGGVSQMDDIYQISQAGLYAVVAGKAIYEHKITDAQMEAYFKGK